MVTISKGKRRKLNAYHVVVKTQIKIPKLIKERPLIQRQYKIAKRLTWKIETKTYQHWDNPYITWIITAIKRQEAEIMCIINKKVIIKVIWHAVGSIIRTKKDII